MSTSNSNSRKTPTSDTNKWFYSAGNLDDSLDSNPSKLTNVGHAPISKNQNESSYKSAGSTYIMPVKGLKDAHSAVVKNTRTDSTHVKSGSPINEKISNTSADKHPIYMTYYVSSNNEVWLISIVEGTITASPLSYNLTYKDKTQIIVSESNEIISYDSSSNQFYRTIPKDTTMDVRCVDRIDADALNKMTVEVLVDD